MGPKHRHSVCTLLSGILVLAAVAGAAGAAETPGRRMIIGFRPGMGPQNRHTRAEAVRRAGGTVHRSFDLVPAVAARLTDQAMKKVKARQDVEYVEEDVVLYAIGQVVPWGVNRIDADLAWPTGNTGRGVRVAILDTGVDYDHPDLRIAGGVNFAGTGKDGSTYAVDWNDGNGHGTHVAGIIAGRNNTVGTIGVAPDASLWAVKVLADNGSGYTSDIIQGLDWCATHGVKVASMSLGGGGTTSLKYACDRAYARGVLIVAAAGNNAGAVSYPAAYSSVVAVSATDSYNRLAYFSNYGSQIELAAPGVSIYSTYKNGSYATMSGTSMACPHVSGVAALTYASGLTTNTAVRARLRSTAEDLGTVGFDTKFGYGLVDAQRAGRYGGTVSALETDANAASSVQITSPADGATVSGVIQVAATAVGEGTTGVEFFADGASIGADDDGSNGWSVAWDTTSVAAGPHSLMAVATESGGRTESSPIRITVGKARNAGATSVSVESITYTAEDRGGGRSLLLTARVVDDLGNPVSKASIQFSVLVNGRARWTLRGATGSDGSVSLRIAMARPGSYEVVVTSVTVDGLTWDGVTPSNGYVRR